MHEAGLTFCAGSCVYAAKIMYMLLSLPQAHLAQSCQRIKTHIAVASDIMNAKEEEMGQSLKQQKTALRKAKWRADKKEHVTPRLRKIIGILVLLETSWEAIAAIATCYMGTTQKLQNSKALDTNYDHTGSS